MSTHNTVKTSARVKVSKKSTDSTVELAKIVVPAIQEIATALINQKTKPVTDLIGAVSSTAIAFFGGK